MERKLAAILCADVFSYSRLMGGNEEATLRTLSSHRKIIVGLIEQHHGRFVNSAGDSVLAEFASVVNAVQCAVEVQAALKVENANVPVERCMEFRIGVNLGDVMVEGEQIYGDGVNVAARLESLAEPAAFISPAQFTSRYATNWRWATKTGASKRSRISHVRSTSGGYCRMGRRCREEHTGIHAGTGGAVCSRWRG